MGFWRKAAAAAAVLLLLALGAYTVFHEYVRAAAFVVQAAGMTGLAAAAADLETQEISEHPVAVPWRGGTLAGRWYAPAERRGAAVLLVPGVHASGIEEPRLVGVARHLASVGTPVLTTELADLKKYTISVRSTDMIEDAALWLSSQPDRTDGRQIDILGISFAGGLGIVAAGRPSVRARVGRVMSFGGHGDLPRTLRYLCTGVQPDGAFRPPHDYGVVIILLGVAERVVPPDQVEPMREVILSFLEASRLDMVDKARSEAEFARARELATALPEPARTLMRHVNDRDVASLGPLLLPHISALAGDPALSPSRSPAPAASAYLLHGADDKVIPAVESELLARELRDRGVDVQLLVTPLITHAEVDRPPSIGEIWRLVHFWGNLLEH